MSRFEDAFSNYQNKSTEHTPTQEDLVRQRHDEIQQHQTEIFFHPANIRFRAIIGRAATILSQNNIATEPHSLLFYDGDTYHERKGHSSNGWRGTPRVEIDAYGWYLNDYPHAGAVDHYDSFFITQDGNRASAHNELCLLPQSARGVDTKEIYPNGDVIKHNDELYIAYSDPLRSTLPVRPPQHEMADFYGTFFDIDNDELKRLDFYTDYGDPTMRSSSFEEYLAKLVFRKIDER